MKAKMNILESFKNLPIGTEFNFDHSSIPLCSGIAKGPWVKISPRKYILSTNPFSVDDIERQRHNENHGLEYEVGTINTKVIQTQ